MNNANSFLFFVSTLDPALLKGPSGFTKPNSKKNRKSPVPIDFDNSINRDDVQSPAYSDISDDSTPQLVDGEGNLSLVFV